MSPKTLNAVVNLSVSAIMVGMVVFAAKQNNSLNQTLKEGYEKLHKAQKESDNLMRNLLKK